MRNLEQYLPGSDGRNPGVFPSQDPTNKGKKIFSNNSLRKGLNGTALGLNKIVVRKLIDFIDVSITIAKNYWL